MKTTAEELFQSPELPQLLRELNARWEAEQVRRHAFWAEADENVKAEFINGEIIYHSPVVYGRHWKASTSILTQLLPYVKNHHLGEVAVEKVMIRLTRNDYEPDICFWTKDKAQNFGDKQSAFPPPDFVVEILSDSTRERDYGIKMTDYALHGILEYWVVDTEAQTIEQYALKEKAYELLLKTRQGSLTSVAIAGFTLPVESVFF
jgi:Uma2 family endonuclease